MMMPNSRAQATMEYLMAYGWSVLVVLFIGVAIWQLGIFDTNPASITSLGFSKIKLQPSGTGLTAGINGNFTGTFTNGVGGKVLIKAVRIKNQETGQIICCSHAGADGGVNCRDGAIDIAGKNALDFSGSPPSLPKVSGGDNFLIQIGGYNGNFCAIPDSVRGRGFNIQVEIDYDSTSGRETVPHTESGSIRGPFE
jgi:hypothetical protein